MLDKKLINDRFNKNLVNYNNYAILQKNISKKLIEILIQKTQINFKNIFEIGCGTGFLTSEISTNLKFDGLYLNDLVENSKGFVEKYSKNFIYGDVEKIDFIHNYDLIISSSVFQWIENFELILQKIKLNLNKNGVFAFSMFIENNFIEIKKIFNVSLNYFTNEKLIELLNKYFDVVYYKNETIVLQFDTIFDLLKHIKNTGVNCVKKENLTKQKIIDMIQSQKKNNFSLTYNYNFVILKNKGNIYEL